MVEEKASHLFKEVKIIADKRKEIDNYAEELQLGQVEL